MPLRRTPAPREVARAHRRLTGDRGRMPSLFDAPEAAAGIGRSRRLVLRDAPVVGEQEGSQGDGPKPSLPAAKRAAPPSLAAKKPAIDEREIDRELAAMKKRLGKSSG